MEEKWWWWWWEEEVKTAINPRQSCEPECFYVL